jgi:Fe-S-cluster containining protein
MDSIDSIDSAHLMERLAERKTEIHAERLARLAAIDSKMTPEWKANMFSRVNILNKTAGSPKSKLPKLYALMEEVSELRAPHLACNAGCSHCCRSIAVEISDLEARHIASATGRAMAMLPPGRHTIPGNAPGRVHTPCPFLKENLCSIYAHRPYNCRSLAVVDQDSLTCSEQNTALTRANDPRAVPVPMTKMQAFDPSYMDLLSRTGTVWADIRQFFPAPHDTQAMAEQDGHTHRLDDRTSA